MRTEQIIVDQQGNGDYATITEAIQAAPYDVETIVTIHQGRYREKVYCDRKAVTLQGMGADQTILCWGDGAYRPHADGRKTGTFRSYTLFLGGERVRVSGMTIENDAGDGDAVGQGLAVYADAECLWMEDVRLIGHQDTLFCAPLPAHERIPGGFTGPRQLSPRRPTRQFYRRCDITGDIDFIFGGADAVFDDCVLRSRDRGLAVNGYIAAPSGSADGLGFVFRRCHMVSPAQPGTVFLARPWRSTGRAALLNCRLDGHIKPEGWDDWQDEKNRRSAYFAEYGSAGAGASASGSANSRAAWSHALTPSEAEALNRQADRLIDEVCAGFDAKFSCPI